MFESKTFLSLSWLRCTSHSDNAAAAAAGGKRASAAAAGDWSRRQAAAAAASSIGRGCGFGAAWRREFSGRDARAASAGVVLFFFVSSPCLSLDILVPIFFVPAAQCSKS